jgi:hypothetical protein
LAVRAHSKGVSAGGDALALRALSNHLANEAREEDVCANAPAVP